MIGWLKRLFGKVENGVAEEIGEAEVRLHRPLYPIREYESVVVPGILMRGSWPTQAKLADLKARGYTRVMSLCAEREDWYQDPMALGMQAFRVPIVDNTAPIPEQVHNFLGCLNKDFGTYVHCEEGVGRTGCMIAAYRVIEQGWPADKALAEAESFGLRLPCQKAFILGLTVSKGAGA